MQNKIGGVFIEYKIAYIWDDNINSVHHIIIEYNGNSYGAILEDILMVDSLVFSIGVLEENLGNSAIYFGTHNLYQEC